MKKLFVLALSCATFSSYSQGAVDPIKEATCKSFKAAVEENLKNTENPKKNTKSATWVKLAESYRDFADQCGTDSLASIKSYETYVKALEVEKAAGGKKAAEIEEALKGERLFTSLMAQGAAHYNNKNLGVASKMFVLANTVNPKDTTATLYAGIVSQQNNDYATAKESFNKYLAQGAKDPAVFYSLATIYKNEKNVEESINILKKGIAVNPGDKDLRAELINSYLATNKLEDAIKDLQHLVQADPKNINNKLNLGIIYDNAGKKEEAKKVYEEILQQDAKNFDANFGLGVLYFNEAVEIKKAVDAMDMKTYAKEGKAVEKKVCEKFTLAKPYFTASLAAKPTDADTVENLKNLDRVLEQCK
ncbi:tetratricopeptide repeat protein [Emticicia sp. CRIBPO]|uniref:tetratricopeptide repeat protein n=1 Tax=Emticicia sp. CRIBPO TaxID=2683258 RepID=UPI0014134D96|nr:tetratricopeptide repeat protein [Emticicia sp. CRIBPO]NBA87652.1 tetratricopeptide repeat protein [Emticicia sp. CRIBPO]